MFLIYPSQVRSRVWTSSGLAERESVHREEVYLLFLSSPAKYSVLLTGPPGVGKFEYLMAQARDALDAGERVVFVTLDLQPEEVRERAAGLSLRLRDYEGTSFAFVDGYSASAETRAESVNGKGLFVVPSLANLEGIGLAIQKAAQSLGTPVRILFYTVSTLFLHHSAQAVARFLQLVTSRIKAGLGSVLYALHDGMVDPMTITALRSLTDGVVEMRFNDRMEQEVRVHHMRGYRVLPVWHRFGLVPTTLWEAAASQ